MICDAKTWSPKKEEKTVLDTGLSLCADQVFDFVKEMGDLKLTCKGVGVTLQNSSLVFIYDAETWSQKKKINISETGLFLCADQVFDFVQERSD